MSGDLASRTILDTFAEQGFEATTTSMRFARVPTFEEASYVAHVASGAIDMGKWWVGDLINNSEGMWGHDFAQLAAITNRSPEGLMVIASVTRRVPEEIRREGLSFSHHEAVASLPRNRQVFWLDFAEENRLSVHELRPHVKREKAAIERAATYDVVSAGGEESPGEFPAVSRPPKGDVRSPLEAAVADVLALPLNLDGETCIPADVRERLRAALETS